MLHVVAVQSLSRVPLFETLGTVARQAVCPPLLPEFAQIHVSELLDRKSRQKSSMDAVVLDKTINNLT